MSGGSMEYVSYQIDRAADQIQQELANVKLRFDSGIFLNRRKYDIELRPYAPEMKSDKAYTEAYMETLKRALVCVRNAAIYTHEIEWCLSGDTCQSDVIRNCRDKVKGNNEAKGIV